MAKFSKKLSIAATHSENKTLKHKRFKTKNELGFTIQQKRHIKIKKMIGIICTKSSA